MTELPTWAIWVASVGTPALAFAGALAGHLIARRSAEDLDHWRHREETMRMLRWAAELAVAGGPGAEVGVAALDALTSSELLQPEDRQLIKAIVDVVVDPLVDVYAEGDPVEEEVP